MRLPVAILAVVAIAACSAEPVRAQRCGYYFAPRRAVVVAPRAVIVHRPAVFYYAPAPRYYAPYPLGYGYSYYPSPHYGGQVFRDHGDWGDYYDDLDDRREDYEDWLEDRREDYEDRMEELRERRKERWEDWHDRWDD